MTLATPPLPEAEGEAQPGLPPDEQARKAAEGLGKRSYVQGIFSDIAPRYDLLNHVLSMNVDKAWRRRALVALQWARTPTGRFLDVCAGTLDVGAALTRQRGFAGFVVGADFALPMLQQGAGKASAKLLAPIAADALNLPMADASMDGAIVAFGIRNVVDLAAGLREVRRVLRPGARFVILEFSTPPSAIVRALYHTYFHHVLPVVGRVVSGHKSGVHVFANLRCAISNRRAVGRRDARGGICGSVMADAHIRRCGHPRWCGRRDRRRRSRLADGIARHISYDAPRARAHCHHSRHVSRYTRRFHYSH